MAYQICTKCVMDTTDPEITFDENGICNHCNQYEKIKSEQNLEYHLQNKTLEKVFDQIKARGHGKKYDCIMGLSGGVDSSYVAHLAVKHGLRPLAVHLDNGWNSELSVHNIHSIVDKLKIDLHTHVIDWEEFRDLQRAYFKANVVDIEALSDHAIFSVIMNLASKENIKYMLSGVNNATEGILPKAWVHRKSDLVNIKDIHKKFGTGKLKTFPRGSTFYMAFKKFVEGYVTVKPLNYMDYSKAEAIELLKRELNWRPYSGKHYESLFTKFYQAYILPVKFNIDKRRAHHSSLIVSGQMTREVALEKLKEPIYDPIELKNDKEFVLKKLGFDEDEFERYLREPAVSHYSYKTDEGLYSFLNKVKSVLSYKIDRV